MVASPIEIENEVFEYIGSAPQKPVDEATVKYLATVAENWGFVTSEAAFVERMTDHPLKTLLEWLDNRKTAGSTAELTKALAYFNGAPDWPADATIGEVIAPVAVSDGLYQTTGAFLEAWKDSPVTTLLHWIALPILNPA